MIEAEVVRLRRLRSSALRVRAVARALATTRAAQDDPLLAATACAAWRVARAVSGRLRAHPYAQFQRDAGVGSIVSNGVVAVGAMVGATSRARAFAGMSRHLRQMARELADARAVTWVTDLSESFGRSLSEFRPLLAQVEKEARPASRKRPAIVRPDGSGAAYGPAAEHDWPYLAL